jgi:hypothetical protein
MLPFPGSLIQARWSGEAAWVPLGALHLDIPMENATSHPSRGDILLCPGEVSETEILFPYGSTFFVVEVMSGRAPVFISAVQHVRMNGEGEHRVVHLAIDPGGV